MNQTGNLKPTTQFSYQRWYLVGRAAYFIHHVYGPHLQPNHPWLPMVQLYIYITVQKTAHDPGLELAALDTLLGLKGWNTFTRYIFFSMPTPIDTRSSPWPCVTNRYTLRLYDYTTCVCVQNFADVRCAISDEIAYTMLTITLNYLVDRSTF